MLSVRVTVSVSATTVLTTLVTVSVDSMIEVSTTVCCVKTFVLMVNKVGLVMDVVNVSTVTVTEAENWVEYVITGTRHSNACVRMLVQLGLFTKDKLEYVLERMKVQVLLFTYVTSARICDIWLKEKHALIMLLICARDV